MAKPYKEGTTWSIRVRVGGRDNYRAGFPSSKEAAAYAAALAKSIRDEGAPQGKGPTKTTRLLMKFRDRDEVLEDGEFIVVPHGVECRPVALESACDVLLIDSAVKVHPKLT